MSDCPQPRRILLLWFNNNRNWRNRRERINRAGQLGNAAKLGNVGKVGNVVNKIPPPIPINKGLTPAFATGKVNTIPYNVMDDLYNRIHQASKEAFGDSRGGKVSGGAGGATKGISEAKLKIPQGLSKEQFSRLSLTLKSEVSNISNDIFIQGSRAGGTAKPTSDIDIGIRVSESEFNDLVKKYFGNPNPGSAKERTMVHALETGKIQSGEAKLRGLRKALEKELGLDVDISIIKSGGKFGNPPYIPIK